MAASTWPQNPLNSRKRPQAQTADREPAYVEPRGRLRQMTMERYLDGFDSKFRPAATKYRLDLLQRVPDESLSKETLAAEPSFTAQREAAYLDG